MHDQGEFWVGREVGYTLSGSAITHLSSYVALAALTGSPVFINVFNMFKDHHFSHNLSLKYKKHTSLVLKQRIMWDSGWSKPNVLRDGL